HNVYAELTPARVGADDCYRFTGHQDLLCSLFSYSRCCLRRGSGQVAGDDCTGSYRCGSQDDERDHLAYHACVSITPVNATATSAICITVIAISLPVRIKDGPYL